MTPDDPRVGRPVPPAPRTPYRAPELVEYGTVAKLTESGGTSVMEFGVPMMRMSTCL